MFILGLGLGMAVSSVGGAVVLYLENRRNKRSEESTHYHITIDEDAELPEFLKNRFAKKG